MAGTGGAGHGQQFVSLECKLKSERWLGFPCGPPK